MSDRPDHTTPEPEEDAAALRYRDAIDELREILRGIESENIDLDDLSTKVERAAWLIRVCRERIERTELRVQRVLEDLERVEQPSEPSTPNTPNTPNTHSTPGSE